MKLGSKILLSYLLIFGIGIYFLVYGERKNIRFRYLEAAEDSLVDQARILASFVSHEMEADSFTSEKLVQIFNHVYNNAFSAQIYELNKNSVDMRVYITDKNGILVFDSQQKDNVGADYSQWRDVYLTLRGEYGARSTHDGHDITTLPTLYVAAPIKIKGEIAGVLTVAKPTRNIHNFVKIAKFRVTMRSALIIIFVTASSIIMTFLITRPIKRLTQYANKIREGKKAALPILDQSEIGDMGRAFDEMREALEGRKYAEKYVQTLTHEIKSPISAIRGASELLEEDMTPEQRSRFLSNIRNESNRIQKLVDRMLALSSLEGKNTLEKMKSVQLRDLVENVLEGFMPIFSKKKLKLANNIDDLSIRGDPFLLRQAISNIIQNAIDFSPPAGQITISSSQKKGYLLFIVEDQGAGIPDFAQDKVFKKFFSMERPDNGKKSTGLGLNFVKEIAELHNGSIELTNIPPTGTRATLQFPI